MMDRCNDPTDKDYNYYGKRGITVCSQWLDYKSYENYIESIVDTNDPSQTIDRIDNDKGYEPGNVKWSSVSDQNINRRIQSNNTSLYKGVSFARENGKWRAEVKRNKIRIYSRYFETADEAAHERAKWICGNIR